MAIPNRVSENAQGIPQAIARTTPSQCHQQIHSLVFIWETRLWFSKMENTTLVFLKGKCTHGFQPEKPSRRHNGPQNASSVSRVQIHSQHSDRSHSPYNALRMKVRESCLWSFFIFGKFFVHPYLHKTAQSHVTILFCYRRFFSFSEFKRIQKSDFLFPASIFGGNPARSWPRIFPAG